MAGRPRKNTSRSYAAGEATESDFLDAAERHFALHGFAGATIRAISEEANANLGALHYYWGSKEALFRAVCFRRLKPIYDARLARFDEIEAEGGVPQIEAVLEAHIRPVFMQDMDNPEKRDLFRQVLLRTQTDPSGEVRRMMKELFDVPSFRFVALLRKACPHLSEQTFCWRLHGVLGMIQHGTTNPDRVTYLTDGAFEASNLPLGIVQMVQFLAAGLRAPEPN